MKLWNWLKRMWWLLVSHECVGCKKRFREVFADPYDIFGGAKACGPCWQSRQRGAALLRVKIRLEEETQNQIRILRAKAEASRRLELEKGPYRDEHQD